MPLVAGFASTGSLHRRFYRCFAPAPTPPKGSKTVAHSHVVSCGIETSASCSCNDETCHHVHDTLSTKDEVSFWASSLLSATSVLRSDISSPYLLVITFRP